MTNLINGKKNEDVYFGRLADELVRYDRIKTFMFNPNSFISLSFSDIKYNLNENEIILLHSLLTEGYFDDLVEVKKNPYIKNNTFETGQPLKTQTYANTIKKNQLEEGEEGEEASDILEPTVIEPSTTESPIIVKPTKKLGKIKF